MAELAIFIIVFMFFWDIWLIVQIRINHKIIKHFKNDNFEIVRKEEYKNGKASPLD